MYRMFHVTGYNAYTGMRFDRVFNFRAVIASSLLATHIDALNARGTIISGIRAL